MWFSCLRCQQLCLYGVQNILSGFKHISGLRENWINRVGFSCFQINPIRPVSEESGSVEKFGRLAL